MDVYFITFDDASKNQAMKLQHQLRTQFISSDMDHLARGFKQQLKEALRYEAKYLVIIGEDELKNNIIQLKNTKTEIQEVISTDKLLDTLKERLNHDKI